MEKEWVLVHSFIQQYRAEIAKQILADEGIHSIIINKRDTTYNSFGDIELYVKGDDVIRAKSRLKQFET